jgi:tRNA threonylcarbamoyladenosine modification (KEOPS) complex Cgi121 subunit
VLGLLQLQLAAHKALTNSSRGRLVTKTLHAELVYNLSGSKHVR